MQILKISNTCNNNCWNCSYKSGSAKTYDEIHSEIERFDTDRPVLLSGGEPTISPNFFRIIDELNRKGFPLVMILTNVRAFAYPDFARKLAEYINVEILAKILGHNEKIHDPLTREDGSLKQTINGIKNLRRLNIRTVAVIEILEQNFVFIEKVIDNLSSIGIRDIIISAPKPVNNENYRKVAAPFHELKSTLMRIAKRPGINVFFEDIPLCFLGGFRDRALDYSLNEQTGRHLAETCNECMDRDNCPKIYEEYHEIFSDEFLQPSANK